MTGQRSVLALALGTVLLSAWSTEGRAQCGVAPQVGCLSVGTPLYAPTRIKNGGVAYPMRHDVTWKWKGGPQMPVPQLGSPETGAHNYYLCVYDTGNLATQLDVPGGANWTRKVGSYDVLYFKVAPGTKPWPPHGVRTVKVVNKPGNAAYVSLKASRNLVPVPLMPFATPEAITIQMTNTAGGCWEANYDAGTHLIYGNTATVFKAKGD